MNDVYKSLREAILKSANTNSIGIVTSVNRIKNTVNVQPVINTLFKDGSSVEFPIIEDVPVINYGTVNTLVLAPLSVNDLVVLHYIKDYIQEYLDVVDVRPITPSDRRYMDLSDVVATPANFKRVQNPSDVRNHSLTYEDKSFIIKHNLGTNNESQIELKDNGSIHISANNNTTSVVLSSDGTITFNADSKIILNSEVEVTKGLSVAKDVIGGTDTSEFSNGPVSLVNHDHGYKDSVGQTATPVPNLTEKPNTPYVV